MCNAWNHPPGCTCGWGGEGHSGHSSYFGFDTLFTRDLDDRSVLPLTNSYTSYVNPNASCPVCGAPVFFYHSPKGGRVFFDELGPPWPKHPCTDNTCRPAPRLRGDTGQPTSHTYKWQRDGWQPLVIHSILGIDKNFLKLTGTWQEARVTLYLKRLVEHHLHDDILSERSLAQLKPSAANTYQLSFLQPNGVPVTVLAFVLLADARAAREQQLKAKKAQSSTGKVSGSYTRKGWR